MSVLDPPNHSLTANPLGTDTTVNVREGEVEIMPTFVYISSPNKKKQHTTILYTSRLF